MCRESAAMCDDGHPENVPARAVRGCQILTERFARPARADDREFENSSSATLAGVQQPGAPARRGWFITIEGPEGAGKTTQAETLADHLRSAASTCC